MRCTTSTSLHSDEWPVRGEGGGETYACLRVRRAALLTTASTLTGGHFTPHEQLNFGLTMTLRGLRV